MSQDLWWSPPRALTPLSRPAYRQVGQRRALLANRHGIAARYAEWEIIGPPGIREVDPDARYLTPWKIVRHADRCEWRIRSRNCSPLEKACQDWRRRSVSRRLIPLLLRHVLRQTRTICADA